MKKESKRMRWPMVAIFLLLFLFLFRGMEVSAQPKPEGTLNIALANLAEEGFLADLGDPEQGRVWPFVYEYPFYLNKDRKLMPGLAEKFEYSKDGLTLTLFLRKGVIWQGGWGEVTADDVKYTYDRLSRSSTSMVASILRAAVKNIDIIDRTVVAFRLKKPSPEVWGDIFGAANAAAPIMCKKYIESVGDEKARFQPIGSGPYRLVERRAGEYLKFQASEKHWRVVPEFKDVMVHLVPEETTRVAMLKTGKIDIAPISAQTVADLRNTADVTAKPWIGGYSLLGCFGGMYTKADNRFKEGYHRADPWVDKRVREAMNIAIDREAIVKSVYKGAARAMPIAWALPGYETLAPIPYDPERAKRLLAEAGYPKGFSLKVVATTEWAPSFEIAQVMEIVAGYFEAIGLKAQIVTMDKVQQFSMNRAAKDSGMIYPWKETYKVSYSGRHHEKFAPGASSAAFQSDELTALINRYESEAHSAKRASYLNDVRDYHYNEKITIPLVLAMPVWAWRNKKVGEWPENPIDKNANFEYARHAKPLNTWRLYTP